jgi:thiamine biosynthesis lipoprotein
MGSDAHLIVVGADAAVADTAVARVEQLESRWSRFRPTSEVCALAGAAGHPVEVSRDTIVLAHRAVEAWRLTGGAFDPTVLGALQAAGYDTDFDHLATERLDPAPPPARVSLVGCTDIVISDTTVTLPPEVGFDAGGIGKGLAADLVVDEVMALGAAGVCVNLGGDLAVRGQSPGPDADVWPISIDHPWSPSPVVVVGVVRAAVASSTTLLRRWTRDGQPRHHLIDPATGAPTQTDLNFVSVVAPWAWEAEVLAKACVLRGSQRVFDLLVPGRHVALAVGRDGTVMVSPGFEEFCAHGAPRHLRAPEPNERISQ